MPGTQFTWTATNSTDWTLGTNWSPAGPPTATDTAIVSTGSIQINGGTVGITDLTLGGSLNGPSAGKGTIAVTGTGEILASDAIAVWSGSTLSVDATSSIDIGTSGTAATGNILVETGHSLLGDGLIAASVINNGTIDATNNGTLASSTGGMLEIQGAVSGTGTMNIEPGATLRIDGSLGAGQTIAFAAGAPETLILGSPTGTIANPITGFGLGDKIEFANGIIVNSASVVNSNTLVVNYRNAGGTLGTYDFTDVTFAANTPLSFTFGTDPVTNAQNVMPTHFFTWVGASSTDYGTPANWNLGSIAPGPFDFVTFSNGIGGTISGVGSSSVLNFYNTGTWSLASGTTLAANIDLNIGRGGGGTFSAGALTIGSGSTLTSAGGFLNVGINAGNTATLTISGGGVLQETAATFPTLYAMTVGSSPASGTLAAGSGSLIVTGAGSKLNLPFAGLSLANSGGNGSVTVSLGGSIFAATTNSNINTSIAIGRLGNGALTVTDPGSQVTAVGEAYVSHTQTGTLLVENSGTFRAALDPLGLGGIFIGFGNTTGVGGTGFATVTTNGVLDSLGFVDVGYRGTAGQLSVLNGGTVEVGTALAVGLGGTISNGTTEAGNGTLTIGAGGVVKLTGTAQANSYSVYLGQSNIGPSVTANAVATVSGAGALLDTNGNGLAVGYYGTGTLTVSQGGTVVSGTPDGTAISALSIARLGNGSVTVTDPGSQFTANGGVYVGRGGTGTLTVENQATMDVLLDGKGAGYLDIGNAGATNGTTLVTGGSGSVLVTTSGYLFSQTDIAVGNDGNTGTLTLNNGGTVEAAHRLTIGNSVTVPAGGFDVTTAGTTTLATATVFSGNGTVTVGAGGMLKIDGTGLSAGQAAIVLGNSAGATGSLNVTDGVVIAGGDLAIRQGSTVSDLSSGGIDVGGSGSISAGAINIDSGHAITGDGLIQASVVNNQGSIVASNGGTLEFSGAVIGLGGLELGAGSSLKLDGAIGSGQSLQFDAGLPETLILGTPGSGLSNALSGLAAGDRIEFAGLTINSASITSPGTVTVNTTTGNYLLGNVTLAAGAPTIFVTGNDSTTGDNYIQLAPCFAAGTRIATERGEVAVEDLQEGDRVQVLLGGAAQPVIWIGHRTVDCARHPEPRKVWPVRIATDAFGPARPARTLWLSPDHAVFVDDVLIPVKYLVNGTTIAQERRDVVTYYHVELPRHSVILAEGMAAESYLDTGDRRNFVNGGGPIALYPDFASRVWEAKACAPLVVADSELGAVRRWVNAMAATRKHTAAAMAG